MSIRAVIFDVYGTLLEVGPPPPDAATRWERLWRERWAVPPRLSLAQFAAECDVIIARDHAAARARGIGWPEVSWPEVVSEVLPELEACAPAARDEFLFQQACLWHTVRLAQGAAETLETLRERGLLLGVASNAQAYTLRELAEALARAGLAALNAPLSPSGGTGRGEGVTFCSSTPLWCGLFERDLCFWSFEHGFSKPDPHVFQILTTRCAARGISAHEILMVGDRLDTDIEPARAAGWRTWHFDGTPSSNWPALADWVCSGAV